MSDLSKEEFLAHIGYVREDIAEMKLLQREANGRTGKLEARVYVLEDRSAEQRSPSKVSATVSAIISGLISGLGVWFSQKQ